MKRDDVGAQLKAALNWGLLDYGDMASFNAIHDQIEDAIAKAEGR